jgi:hypothetical protein
LQDITDPLITKSVFIAMPFLSMTMALILLL